MKVSHPAVTGGLNLTYTSGTGTYPGCAGPASCVTIKTRTNRVVDGEFHGRDVQVMREMASNWARGIGGDEERRRLSAAAGREAEQMLVQRAGGTACQATRLSLTIGRCFRSSICVTTSSRQHARSKLRR